MKTEFNNQEIYLKSKRKITLEPFSIKMVDVKLDDTKNFIPIKRIFMVEQLKIRFP